MSDLLSLDMEPKQASAPSQPSNEVWYKTSVFRGVAIVTFLCIMTLPQPEWLQVILQHPIGGIALAWATGVAMLPELEWWVVGLGVLGGYIVFVVSGLIETNLEQKRKKSGNKTSTKKKTKEEDDEEAPEEKKEEEDEASAATAPEEFRMNRMSDYTMVPMASNAF